MHETVRVARESGPRLSVWTVRSEDWKLGHSLRRAGNDERSESTFFLILFSDIQPLGFLFFKRIQENFFGSFYYEDGPYGTETATEKHAKQ